MHKINIFNIFASQGSWDIKLLKLIDHVLGSCIAFILPAQKINKLNNIKVQNILVIRPGGIGDAVFLLPVLDQLRSQGIQIDVLCERRNEQVFRSQGYAAYTYNQVRSFKKIFNRSYDVVIDSEQWHLLSAIVAYFIKTKHRIGFATRPLREKLFNIQVMYREEEYELDNFKRLFEEIVHKDLGNIEINDSFKVPSIFQEWALHQIHKESVSIFLGGSISLRQFSKKQLRRIIDDILLMNLYVVLIGGRDVLERAEEIVKEYKDKKVLSFVGIISLVESAALIQRSEKFIGPDSGLMHLACAVGTPVRAIFGPGNLIKWQPKGQKDEMITKKVACSPCTWFGYTIPTCKGTYHCLDKNS